MVNVSREKSYSAKADSVTWKTFVFENHPTHTYPRPRYPSFRRFFSLHSSGRLRSAAPNRPGLPSHLSSGVIPVAAQCSASTGVDPIEFLHKQQKLSHGPLLFGSEGVHARSKLDQFGVFRAGRNQTKD